MTVRPDRAMRALGVGLLVLVLLVAGAVPAGAGGRGPEDSDRGGAEGARPERGGDRQRAEAGQRPDEEPAAERSRPSRTEQPARQRPAPRSPDPRPPAARPGPEAPAEPGGPERAERPERPERPERSEEPEQQPEPEDHGRVPRREVVAAPPKVAPEAERPAEPARVQVRSAGAAPSATVASRPEPRRTAAATVRQLAAPTTGGDPTVALFAAPAVSAPVVPLPDEPPSRGFLPSLPGPGHPAFPGLLAAVLMGIVALGVRGDRRDPKLAASVIDERDERTPFG